ncbi:MAG: hypothetical protein KJ061_15730, partial [Vicinamibacteraceae bacterium]|nr:hypothetical protein [Vicinamibacteraceae bacterium]
MVRRTTPPAPAPLPYLPFEDGLGRRVLDADGTERTYVPPELGRAEHSLRDRIGRLANFRHAKFARLRSVETEGKKSSPGVYVLSDPVEGVRLWTLLQASVAAGFLIDVNAALQVVRDILPGLALLHDSRNVTHGAIGPERIVLAPQGRCVIVDHGFGLALEKLRYPRSRLWKDFRIPMPPSAGLPQFDQRADVAQVGVVVLELLLGRPLALNDFPNRLRQLVDEARERLVNGTAREVSASLRAWFERALPVEARRPFATALEAQVALEDAIKKERLYAPGAAALRGLYERYAQWLAEHPAAEGDEQEPEAEAGGTQAEAAPPRSSRAPRAPRALLDEEAEEIRALEETLARLAAEEAAQREAESHA